MIYRTDTVNDQVITTQTQGQVSAPPIRDQALGLKALDAVQYSGVQHAPVLRQTEAATARSILPREVWAL
jgi:hypothetical protein